MTTAQQIEAALASPLVICLGQGSQVESFLRQAKDPHQSLVVLVPKSPDRTLALASHATVIEYESASQTRSPLWGFFISRVALLPRLTILKDPTLSTCDASHLETQIDEAKRLAEMTMGTSIDDTLLGLRYSVQNLESLVRSAGFGVLRNRFANKTLVSIATGPSLDTALPFLRAHANSLALIACESSLPTLHRAGITPHFVTALEREDVVATYLGHATLPSWVTLIGPELLSPQALANFSGQTAFYPQAFGASSPLKLDFLGPPLGTGLSAGNLNISAAIQMGFKKVVLVGHNLAHDPSSLRTHAYDATESQFQPASLAELRASGSDLDVPSQDGHSMVPTHRYYEVFRMQIESEISQHPEIMFINTAAFGARIDGAAVRTIESALTPDDHHGHEVKAILNELWPKPSASEIDARRRTSRQSLALVAAKIKETLLKIDAAERDLVAEQKRLKRGDRVSGSEMAAVYQRLQNFRVSLNLDTHLSFAMLVCFTEVFQIEQKLSSLESQGLALTQKFSAYLDGVQKIFGVWRATLPRIQEILSAEDTSDCYRYESV